METCHCGVLPNEMPRGQVLPKDVDETNNLANVETIHYDLALSKWRTVWY